MNGKRRLLGSFTHGSMANALPQAIGVEGFLAEDQVTPFWIVRGVKEPAHNAAGAQIDRLPVPLATPRQAALRRARSSSVRALR